MQVAIYSLQMQRRYVINDCAVFLHRSNYICQPPHMAVLFDLGELLYVKIGTFDLHVKKLQTLVA